MPGIELAKREIASIDNFDQSSVMEPINGEAYGKHFLSLDQLTRDDIELYLENTALADKIINDPTRKGINLLQFNVLKAFMRQPSTRTGGSMETAMEKLGGSAAVISGSAGSSEAKGETYADSVIAFATQTDVLGIRTAEDFGPAFAAYAISEAVRNEKLSNFVPVINLGDGKNEHPTQAIGDMYTLKKHFNDLEGKTLAVVGDHERYRAFHSLMVGAHTLGMNILAIESPIAPLPQGLVDKLGDKLTRTEDLDEAMEVADCLYMGRNPDEYKGEDPIEMLRADALSKAYSEWIVDHNRLQQMPKGSIVMHPRPRRDELHPSIDNDPRAKDIEQMKNMIPARMAILALHLGKSIVQFETERRVA